MVTMYRKYEFRKELSEDDVWTVFQLDQEYAKFLQQKNQLLQFLEKAEQLDASLGYHKEDLERVTT